MQWTVYVCRQYYVPKNRLIVQRRFAHRVTFRSVTAMANVYNLHSSHLWQCMAIPSCPANPVFYGHGFTESREIHHHLETMNLLIWSAEAEYSERPTIIINHHALVMINSWYPVFCHKLSLTILLPWIQDCVIFLCIPHSWTVCHSVGADRHVVVFICNVLISCHRCLPVYMFQCETCPVSVFITTSMHRVAGVYLCVSYWFVLCRRCLLPVGPWYFDNNKFLRLHVIPCNDVQRVTISSVRWIYNLVCSSVSDVGESTPSTTCPWS